MSLTRQEVQKIAHLARLALTEAQLIEYQEQLSAVLDYAEMLNELDLSSVVPTAHAVSRQNVMRADEVAPSLPTAEALANAEQHQQDQFYIQSVLND
jgi:aspartyl-tRNA(Asn)/glutamyl-tRNA(Gln) amidotransferase subunit C